MLDAAVGRDHLGRFLDCSGRPEGRTATTLQTFPAAVCRRRFTWAALRPAIYGRSGPPSERCPVRVAPTTTAIFPFKLCMACAPSQPQRNLRRRVLRMLFYGVEFVHRESGKEGCYGTQAGKTAQGNRAADPGAHTASCTGASRRSRTRRVQHAAAGGGAWRRSDGSLPPSAGQGGDTGGSCRTCLFQGAGRAVRRLAGAGARFCPELRGTCAPTRTLRSY